MTFLVEREEIPTLITTTQCPAEPAQTHGFLCGGCVLTLLLVEPVASHLHHNFLSRLKWPVVCSSFSAFCGPHFPPSWISLPSLWSHPHRNISSGPTGGVLWCNWLHTSHPDMPQLRGIRPLAPCTLMFHHLHKATRSWHDCKCLSQVPQKVATRN